MGASTSSLAAPFHPSAPFIKDTAHVHPPSERAMISHSPIPVQQHRHVRFNSKTSKPARDSGHGSLKSKPIVVPQYPPVDQNAYPSTKSKKTYPVISSSPDEHPFSRSKTAAPVSPAMPGSKSYSSVSAPRRSPASAPNGNGRGPVPPSSIRNQGDTLPRGAVRPNRDSTDRASKPSSATVTRNSSTVRAVSGSLTGVDGVDVASHKRCQNQHSATRTVTKSTSRSTIGSSSKMSTSSSSGALSSKEGPLPAHHGSSSSRSHNNHEQPNASVKRRRPSEDMKREALKPIHEVESRDHHLRVNANHLPIRPPGLGSNRNSAASSVGAQIPVATRKPAGPSPQQVLLDSQTKRLSQILATPSVVVLSAVNRRTDHHDVSEERVNGEAQADVQEHQQPDAEVVSQGVESELQPKAIDSEIVPERAAKESCKEDKVGGPEGVETQISGPESSATEEVCDVRVDPPQTFLSLPLYLSDPDRLCSLLQYLSFSDWCSLFNTSKEIRLMISQNELLREEVLERFLKEAGYSRWAWREPEPVMISLADMLHYIKGTSIPISEYARVSERFLKSLPEDKEEGLALANDILRLANTTRAYNRMVLRLRAQSEMLDQCDSMSSTGSSFSTPSSRRSSFVPGSASNASFISSSVEAPYPRHETSSPTSETAQICSPLYRPNRAALLRVFVPSPHGEWLSDASVLECEAELKRAGLTRLMRLGDVAWDIALGDERGNMGKLIWDGCYLLDLDYTYSSIGDIPRHIPSLALPPAHFHRIVRGGPLNMDPVARIDVSPWGEEIARNLQLMQDRMMAETPQGLQNVVRWIHRSTFTIRPPSIRSSIASGQRSIRLAQTGIPIRDSNGQTIHPSWYGSVIIETDGTSESLDDLKERCGAGVFPQRAVASVRHGKSRGHHEKMVWRILREKSRPGEMWIRVITPRERLM